MTWTLLNGTRREVYWEKFSSLLKNKRDVQGEALIFFLPLDVILCGFHVWSQGMHSEMETKKRQPRVLLLNELVLEWQNLRTSTLYYNEYLV